MKGFLKMITVQTDGATNENLRKSGLGIFIKHAEGLDEYAILLPYMSNHEAEFQAVVQALKICNEKFPNDILAFQTDSKVVVDSIEKQYTTNKLFKPFLSNILKRSENHPHFFIKWIPNTENKRADQLAKKAICP